MEAWKLWITILMLAEAGALGFGIAQVSSVMGQPITLNLNGQTIKDNQPYYGDITDLTILGKRFAANHKYNLTDYNCVNYTEDFVFIAKSLGFNVQKMQGCKYSNLTECHAWVQTSIDYEPQSGQFEDVRGEYQYGVGVLT